MRNPSQVLLLAVLMTSLILPPPLFAAGGKTVAPKASQAPRSILLVGDSLSIGLGQQLEAVYAGRSDARFAHLGKVSSGLASPAFFDWNAHLTSLVKDNHPDVVLIMVGANDDKNLPEATGRAAVFKTPAWDAAYAARLAKLHAIARAENPKAFVYFIGVPVMADKAFDASMIHVNGVLARTARSLPDCAYIDVRDVLATTDGTFAPLVRGADGKTAKLRAGDGVHISAIGSRLLAARCLEALGKDAGAPVGQLLAALPDRNWHPVATADASGLLAEAKTPAPKPASTPVQVASAKPAPAVKAVTYTVASGDTMHAVAKRLGLTDEALAAANPNVDPRRMSIGQVLSLPAGAHLVAEASARPATASAASGVRSHAVAEGDNFWSVARRYDVSVAALTQANPGVDPTRLRIGQSLAIPSTSKVAEAGPAAAEQTYVVAEGDNFWAIARHLGVDVAALKRVNGSVDPQKLRPGQVLSLPGSVRAEAEAPATPAENRDVGQNVSDAGLYPVSKGDTLWGLSRRFGVSLDTLLSANSDLDPSRLRVGQLVTIPAGASVASAETMVFPVAAGDTLWGIAKRFDVTVEAILAANPGIDPLHLREGQNLRVPTSLAAVAASAGVKASDRTAGQETDPAATDAKTGAAAKVHTVSEGDTLWDLSRRYGVSVRRLLSANAGIDPMRLRVGQTVVLPGTMVSMAAR